MNEAPERQPGKRLSALERQQLLELRAAGLTYEQIAAQVGRAKSSVWQLLHGRVPPVAGRRAGIAADLRQSGIMDWDTIARAVGYANGHVARIAVTKHRARLREHAAARAAATTPWE